MDAISHGEGELQPQKYSAGIGRVQFEEGSFDACCCWSRTWYMCHWSYLAAWVGGEGGAPWIKHYNVRVAARRKRSKEVDRSRAGGDELEAGRPS